MGGDERVSAAQRDKGARAEREVAAIFQAAGFDCNRVPNSGGLRIKGDLYGDVPAHVESKWQAVIRLGEWWRQTRAEAPAGVLPVLAVRLTGSRHRPKEWVAVVPLEALVALLAAQAVAA